MPAAKPTNRRRNWAFGSAAALALPLLLLATAAPGVQRYERTNPQSIHPLPLTD